MAPYNLDVRIEASAPTRIDLAGGTLDIWPLYLFHDGAQTLNAAISLRAHCEIRSRTDASIVIDSEDAAVRVQVDHWSALRDHHDLRLLGRLLHFFQVGGVELRTRSESPVGAGIAGSSALNIAVCGALNEWTGAALSADQMFQIAMNVEAQAIDVPTGVQDYRPAFHGGISAVELGVNGVRRIPLEVPAEALADRLALAYTNASRNSGINNWDVMKRHIDGDRQVQASFGRDLQHRGGDASRPGASGLARSRPTDRCRVGESQAARAGGHDSPHRCLACRGDERRSGSGQSLWCGRRRVPVLLC